MDWGKGKKVASTARKEFDPRVERLLHLVVEARMAKGLTVAAKIANRYR
jgi:hypothetical protein